MLGVCWTSTGPLTLLRRLESNATWSDGTSTQYKKERKRSMEAVQLKKGEMIEEQNNGNLTMQAASTPWGSTLSLMAIYEEPQKRGNEYQARRNIV